jgi:excisionase family DNA binding protein
MTQATTDTADRMLTVAEACAAIGIGRTTFYVLLGKGEIDAIDVSGRASSPPTRIGHKGGHRRTLRVPQSAVDAFKARNAISAPK